MEQNIYIGIIPYDENGDFEFAGRSEETWALYDRIARNDYTVYYAASGEGKSSLIRAGLLPILRRRNYFPVYIVFEDKEFENISSIENFISNRIEAEEARHNVSFEQSEWSKSHFTPEQSERLSGHLWWKLRNYCFKRGDTEMRPLYIFDQFEEVFTKATYDWTDRFFTWLEEISTDYVPNSLREVIRDEIPVQKNFKALFSFRTEYLGDLDYWCVQKHFIPSLQENRMCLKPLTPNGAREVISLNNALEEYTDKIIQGCAEPGSNIENVHQPCVYALILSVVCQTLSEMPDDERDSFLENLNADKDKTIDGILLRFYKKKLKDAGLDYTKDEKIIADIEDALVDEKGKRSRRDTNDPSLLPLREWIERLNDKKNGLIKEVGRKEENGEIIKTVEFPHDRLCRAIDSSRKERQGKVAWKLKRQGEFMQLGIISVIMGIIAFLWNALMPALKPVIVNDSNKTLNLFLNNYLRGDQSVSGSYTLDEAFSTLLLMILLVLFVHLITIFVIRKGRKWQRLSLVISSLGTLSFVFLLYRNASIHFTYGYVNIFTVIGAFACLVCVAYSLVKLKGSSSKKLAKVSNEDHYSFWPLWGGLFLFACYAFYECLCRVTFGINEPCDSCWALSLLPLLFTAWAWGFFNIAIEPKLRKNILIMTGVSVLLLVPLSIISYLPYNSFKQSYGMTLSLLLIILWISVFAYILWHANSSSKYYLFSNWKRTIATALGSLVILAAYFMNLGYNPFEIAPKSVCHVSSWRSVIVCDNDSSGNKKFGIVYPTDDSNIIIPCHIPDNLKQDTSSIRIDSLLLKGKNIYSIDGRGVPIVSTFAQSPFDDNKLNLNHNYNNTLSWDPLKRQMTAYIPSTPTLEQYLHQILLNKASGSKSIADSIDYYAAKLFSEMRTANINFAVTGETYNLTALKSLNKLDSLQHVALSNELAMLKDSIISYRGRKIKQSRAEVLEDKDLVDFHRELSRTILLCLIKDRASQSDMPAMFTLAQIYLLAYFTSVPAMNVRMDYNYTGRYEFVKTYAGIEKYEYHISSDDILNKKLFAWYGIFNCLYLMDIAWNAEAYEERQNAFSKRLLEYLTIQEETKNELLSALSNTTSLNNAFKNVFKEIKESNTLNEKASKLLEYMKSSRNLKINDTQFYKSILAQHEEMELILNTYTIDESLRQLKDTVLHTLLPMMREYKTGIYNNDLENVCKGLILVAAYRGNDVQEDMDSLSNYLDEKNKLFVIINNLNRDLKPIIEQKKTFTKNLNELIERIEEKK